MDLNTFGHIFQAAAKLNQTFSLMITPYILKKLRYIWQYKTTHTPTKCVVSETLVHKTGNVQYKWTVEFQSTMKRVIQRQNVNNEKQIQKRLGIYVPKRAL